MDKFLELLAGSVIVQGFITVLVLGLWAFMVATGQEIPSELSAILTLVVGFFFGSKTGVAQGMYSAQKPYAMAPPRAEK